MKETLALLSFFSRLPDFLPTEITNCQNNIGLMLHLVSLSKIAYHLNAEELAESFWLKLLVGESFFQRLKKRFSIEKIDTWKNRMRIFTF